jgi:hypothetical protein
VEEQPGKSVIISGTKLLDDAGCGSDDEDDDDNEERDVITASAKRVTTLTKSSR